MWRFPAVALAAGCAVLAFAGTGIAASSGKPAKTRITIQTWPKGLFGYVSSAKPARCAARRSVLVYRQGGRRQRPAKDKVVARVRSAAKPGSYQWSTRRVRTGKFYAKVVSKRGCGAGYSKTVAEPVLGGSGATGAGYPSCSPWVSEGTTTICKFDETHLTLSNCANFGSGSGDCSGRAETGPFPWAVDTSGSRAQVSFFWNGGGRRTVTLITYRDGQGNTGAAHLGGVVPASNSPNFSIIDGFAQNDLGYPNGDHFYTPDIPGQAAGEVGGPLFINFVNGHPGADVYIRGYLYLKR